MIRFINIAVIISVLIVYPSFSQTNIGNTIDNYAGVNSLLMNPANVSGSKTKLEFNIFSVSAFVGNDYLSVDFNDLKNIGNGFDFDSDVSKTPTEQNNFFGNVDLLGPSVMFRLNEKSGLGINTRVRTFFNLNNISGLFYESISEGFDLQTDFQTEMTDLSGNVHAWGEVGVTYGRIIIEDESHRLKLGTTLKYLAGAGGVFTSSPLLSANFNSSLETLTTRGTLAYGYTSGFDTDEINFTDITSGFGADFGLVYEMRPRSEKIEDPLYFSKPYKLRIGLSVLDIGAINYQGNTEFNYNINATVDVIEFEENDFVDVLEENYESTEVVGSSTMGLPSSLQVFADYHFKKSFFMSFNGSYSLRSETTFKVNNAINTVSITPRMETKRFSIYSPVSLRQYQSGIMWGFGLRFGPLTVGSGSALSNLLSNSSKSTDFYLGFKVPLNGKSSL